MKIVSCSFVITPCYYRRNKKLHIITKTESCLIKAEFLKNNFFQVTNTKLPY